MTEFSSSFTGWTRNGTEDIIENLLIRTIISNFENPPYQLTCTINRLSNIVNYLTYSNYLTGQYMITSCENNLSEETSTITIQSVVQDNASVNITY